MTTTAKKKTPPASPTGVEIVPLLAFRPGRAAAPWGDQYVSGVMNGDGSRPCTFPGVPIVVKDKAYADLIIAGKLAKYPDDFQLDDLASVFRAEFGNPARWAHTVTPSEEKDV